MSDVRCQICTQSYKSDIRHLTFLFSFVFRTLSMGMLKQIAEYLYIRKPDPDRPKTQFVKYMHGINRLSILLFLLALIILVIKLTIK